MKVLIKRNCPNEHLLFKLGAEEIINEVILHVNRGSYTKAIEIILIKGTALENVRDLDLPLIEANLILTEKQAHFDLLGN